MPTQSIYVYLRLLNERRFAAGMRSSAASVAAFKEEVAAANTWTGKLAATSNLGVAGLYAIGSASSVVARGLVASAAAVGYFGTKFNATMESNQLAFQKFAGSADEAKRFTNELFQIAAKTPFSFSDVTTAGRRLLAFGFDVQQTTDLLKVMGDTISYTGGSTDEILRLGKALGDIRAKGKLMQQEMNQLANVGIPIRDVLARGGLELTTKQLSNIGRAGIPADRAITAIKTGLEDLYGGGAAKYLDTFNGQLQRLHDNLQFGAGTATSGMFGPLKSGLKFINDNFDKINTFLGGSKFQGTLKSVGMAFAGAFLLAKSVVVQLWNAFKPAMPFFQNVLLPLLEGVAVALIAGVVVGFKLLIFAIKIAANVLGFIGKLMKPFKPLFFAIGYVIGTIFGPAILRAIGWLSKFGGVFRIIGGIANLALTPLRFFYGVVGFIGRNLAWASRELTFFIGRFGGPLGTALGAVIRFGIGVKTWFVDVFVNAFNWAARLADKVAGLGPAVLRLGIRIGNWLFVGIRDTVFRFFTGAVGFAAGIGRGIADWLNKNTPFGDKIDIGFTSFRIPALAAGGHIMGGGYALVGDNGPEILHLPTGSSVTPTNRVANVRPLGAGPGLPQAHPFDGVVAHFTIPIQVGRRQIGEAVGEYMSDRRALA